MNECIESPQAQANEKIEKRAAQAAIATLIRLKPYGESEHENQLQISAHNKWLLYPLVSEHDIHYPCQVRGSKH